MCMCRMRTHTHKYVYIYITYASTERCICTQTWGMGVYTHGGMRAHTCVWLWVFCMARTSVFLAYMCTNDGLNVQHMDMQGWHMHTYAHMREYTRAFIYAIVNVFLRCSWACNIHIYKVWEYVGKDRDVCTSTFGDRGGLCSYRVAEYMQEHSWILSG